MSNVPNAWEDEWSTAADKSPNTSEAEPKRISSRVTKAQRRAQNSEFNKQLWAEAEAPQEPNYFLQSRNVVPLRSEYKPPPILLSRKGPTVQSSSRPSSDNVSNSNLHPDSSEDEDLDKKAKALTLAEQQAQAAKNREVKQRKYEERRQELFGTTNTPATMTAGATAMAVRSTSRSGTSSPNGLTPPGSRSATPNRGRGRGSRRGGGSSSGNGSASQSQPQSQQQQPTRLQQQQQLYDPSYAPKPDSSYLKRRENNDLKSSRPDEIQPIRSPRGPDGSGRGGFGFVNRGGGNHHSAATATDKSNDSEFMGPG